MMCRRRVIRLSEGLLRCARIVTLELWSPTLCAHIWRFALAPVFAPLLDQFCDQRCPPGLVACPQAGASVAVEVFIEQDEVSPVRIIMEHLRRTVDRPTARVIPQEHADQSV